MAGAGRPDAFAHLRVWLEPAYAKLGFVDDTRAMVRPRGRP